jgi:hypothetical protein
VRSQIIFGEVNLKRLLINKVYFSVILGHLSNVIKLKLFTIRSIEDDASVGRHKGYVSTVLYSFRNAILALY